MQVTISLLPASLSLVHIPRCRLTELSHQVVKQIIQRTPPFFNITCNELEVSIFASSPSLLEDFEPVARRDRQRQRSRSKSGRAWKEPIEISSERWSVLQIDSHSEKLDTSGARVHELSAPLAAAGISILFQSSYMADFVFVKESRLVEVLTLLAAAGFDSYTSSPTTFISPPISPPRSPASPDTCQDVDALADLSTSTVFTRCRTETSAPWPISAVQQAEQDNVTPPVKHVKSHSPPPGDVRIISSDLTCVGLSDDAEEAWSLKIIKLVAYPELLPHKISGDSDVPSPSTASSPYSSSDEEDGYFSRSPVSCNSVSSLASTRSTHDWSPNPQHSISPLSPISPATNVASKLSSPTYLTDQSGSLPAHTPFKVPFFSFTKTSEGSSLTTDANLLAALFPPEERYMVICCGELDSVDAAEGKTEDDDAESDDDGARSTLKCLQIDLRKYGLDKFGLVNRYATILERNGINHLYSSTYKTACLLVDKKNAMRAQMLLRSC